MPTAEKRSSPGCPSEQPQVPRYLGSLLESTAHCARRRRTHSVHTRSSSPSHNADFPSILSVAHERTRRITQILVFIASVNCLASLLRTPANRGEALKRDSGVDYAMKGKAQ